MTRQGRSHASHGMDQRGAPPPPSCDGDIRLPRRGSSRSGRSRSPNALKITGRVSTDAVPEEELEQRELVLVAPWQHRSRRRACRGRARDRRSGGRRAVGRGPVAAARGVARAARRARGLRRSHPRRHRAATRLSTSARAVSMSTGMSCSPGGGADRPRAVDAGHQDVEDGCIHFDVR